MGAVQLAGAFFFFFFLFYSVMISLVDARVCITSCLFVFLSLFVFPSALHCSAAPQSDISRRRRGTGKAKMQEEKESDREEEDREKEESLVIDLVDFEEE